MTFAESISKHVEKTMRFGFFEVAPKNRNASPVQTMIGPKATPKYGDTQSTKASTWISDRVFTLENGLMSSLSTRGGLNGRSDNLVTRYSPEPT